MYINIQSVHVTHTPAHTHTETHTHTLNINAVFYRERYIHTPHRHSLIRDTVSVAQEQ